MLLYEWQPLELFYSDELGPVASKLDYHPHTSYYNSMTTILVFILTLAHLSSAAESSEREDVANGYRLKDFGAFDKDWHLVTVRYRKDTTEMRFTYANDKAWKVLQAGGRDYPDGAIFAKIGAKTSDDSAFPNSVVPSHSARYQFMVKDKTKYVETEGWGYSLFDGQGTSLLDKAGATAQACAACHRLVPERGYVFSQMTHLSPFESNGKKIVATDKAKSRFEFSTMDASKLPPLLQAQVPRRFSKVRMLEGSLRDHLFAGTLDEVRPTLAKEAHRAKLPAVLAGRDFNYYSLVYEDSAAGACSNAGTAGISFRYVFTAAVPKGKTGNMPLIQGTYCEAGKP